MVTTQPDISKLIDHRNQKLWDSLSGSFDITLQFHDSNEYACYYRSKVAIMYIPVSYYSIPSFTHELLHLYLDSKNIYIGAYLKLRFKANDSLVTTFTDDLLDHISNTLDHSKMLPLFLRLGFERNDFLYDYHTPKCTSGEIELINLLLRPVNSNWQLAADLYLGKFFGINSCPNNTIDYSSFLHDLKNASNSLYNTLETFWQSWLTFDLESSHWTGYHDFCDIFIDELESWVLDFDSGLVL